MFGNYSEIGKNIFLIQRCELKSQIEMNRKGLFKISKKKEVTTRKNRTARVFLRIVE